MPKPLNYSRYYPQRDSCFGLQLLWTHFVWRQHNNAAATTASTATAIITT